MNLPIAQILGADYNRAHWNHIHVTGDPMFSGTPPLRNPGMSPAITVIYDALEAQFGPGAYFLDVDHHWEENLFVIDDPDIQWTHMGGWNRRYIGSGTTWSQHSWWNGLDIGPYLGLEQQKPFRQFLEGDLSATLDDMPQFTEHEAKELRELVRALDEIGSNGGFAKFAVELIRRERDLPLHKRETLATPTSVPDHTHKPGGVA